MAIQHPWVRVVVYSLMALAVLSTIIAISTVTHAVTAQEAPVLELQKPENVTVQRTYDPSLNQFTVAVAWEEMHDSLTALIKRK